MSYKIHAYMKWGFLLLLLSLVAFLVISGSSTTQAFNPDCEQGDIALDEETYQRYIKPVEFPEGMPRALPASYDARDYGLVTPPKNQGSCGSCWAFASVGAIESHLIIEGLPFSTDLSEQQQVSCNSSMWGCCGGSSAALRFWETGGPLDETCFAFGDGGTSCPPIYNSVPCSNGSHCPQLDFRVINYHTVNSSQFKDSLYIDGPSYWRFTVYSDFKPWYSSASPGDVYENGSGTYNIGGHAVLLIGWDDNKQAYLVKNSWGASSGPQGDGTFWIAYDGHFNYLNFQMANFDLVSVAEDETFLPLIVR